MNKIFSVDRIEGNIAVCISDDDEKFEILTSLIGNMSVRDVFSANINGSTLEDIVPLPQERDRRIKSNTERLQRLAKNKK